MCADWQKELSVSHLNYFGRLEASLFPEVMVPSQQEDDRHFASSSQAVGFSFSQKLLVKERLSETLNIYIKSHLRGRFAKSIV